MAQKVLFKRKTTEEINDLEVEDGSLIYNIDNGKTYMDYENKRIQTGGNADTMIAIGGNEPTDDDIKLWIPESNIKTKASEVIDSLDGNETDYAPSVRAVNDKFDDIDKKFIYSSNEQIIGYTSDKKPVYRKILNLGKLQSSSETTFDTGLSNIDYLIHFSGSTKLENSYGIHLPTNGDALDGVIFRARFTNDFSKLVTERTSHSFYNTYFMIIYTKTTD